MLTVFLLVRAFAFGVLSAADRSAGRPRAAESVVIDLNRASLGELTALPGIGPVRAGNIVLHRVRHGPFASVDGLLAVDGIGDETVAELRPHAVALPVAVPR
ncbi:MAG: helix-hairpin-helix domain-containing protein [Planctomycetota bacterium]